MNPEDSKSVLSSPIIDHGDNQFLSHLGHDISLNGEPVGHAMLSIYDAGLARKMNSSPKWLAREGSYLNKYKSRLFDSNSLIAKLPSIIGQSQGCDASVLIVEQIAVQPDCLEDGLEVSALKEIFSRYERQVGVVLLPNWIDFGISIGVACTRHIEYFQSMGFMALDDRIMIRYLDNYPVDSSNMLPF